MTRLKLIPEFFYSPETGFSEGPIVIENGVVMATGDACEEHAPDSTLSLRGTFLISGFTNAHSHAFQRAMRGTAEFREPTAMQDDFWTWRQEMYRLALALNPTEMKAIAKWAYLDMLKSGFTSVGEFHYVHHDLDGAPYADSTVLSRVLAEAAQEIGIRLSLLQTAYARAGFNRPKNDQQRRFIFSDVDQFLSHASRVKTSVCSPNLVHGFALHSVRACPEEWIREITQEANGGSDILHMHACEQLAEIDECEAEHGCRPMELLARNGALSPKSTVVHATHLSETERKLIAVHRPIVCVCPTTERNLGDGLCPIRELAEQGTRFAIGTDSHVRIEAVEEFRAFEDHERLRLQRRNVLTRPGHGLGESLLSIISGGADSIGQPQPGFSPGCAADFVGVSIGPEGQAYGHRAALDAFFLAGTQRDITDVFVAGEHLIKNGQYLGQEPNAVRDDAIAVMKRAQKRLAPS